MKGIQPARPVTDEYESIRKVAPKPACPDPTTKITSKCVTSAVRKMPTAAAMGATTSPPKNSRKPWSPLAPISEFMPPGTSIKLRSPTRSTEISVQIKANTNGLRKLPCRGSPAKKAEGWSTTRLTTSTKLLIGSERSYSLPEAVVLKAILTLLRGEKNRCDA